jgi:uncharacterized protein (TIGR02145 family)
MNTDKVVVLNKDHNILFFNSSKAGPFTVKCDIFRTTQICQVLRGSAGFFGKRINICNQALIFAIYLGYELDTCENVMKCFNDRDIIVKKWNFLVSQFNGDWNKIHQFFLENDLKVFDALEAGMTNPAIQKDFLINSNPTSPNGGPVLNQTNDATVVVQQNSKNSDKKPMGEIKSVKIGTQIWSQENVNVDRFRNGDPIYQAKTVEEWQRASENNQPVWCYYDYDPKNGDKYGKLYNWYAVNDPRGLAPKGWHVPSIVEWKELIHFLGGKTVSDKKIKSEDGWENYSSGGKKTIKCPNCLNWNAEYRRKVPCHECRDNRYVVIHLPIEVHSGNGTNQSGFTGLPAGGYYALDGEFYGMGDHTTWWSSTGDGECADCRVLTNDEELFGEYDEDGYEYDEDDYTPRIKYWEYDNGFSVRCLKD